MLLRTLNLSPGAVFEGRVNPNIHTREAD